MTTSVALSITRREDQGVEVLGPCQTRTSHRSCNEGGMQQGKAHTANGMIFLAENAFCLHVHVLTNSLPAASENRLVNYG